MLTLADASRFFDRTPVMDAYALEYLFDAQLDLYSDARRDSATAYRRIMSVRPGTYIPADRVVSILGTRWLVGTMESDGLEALYREKYVLHPAKTNLNVSRLSGFLTATVARTVWGDVEWVKDIKAESVTSIPTRLYSAYLQPDADVREYDVLWVGAIAYLVGSVHKAPSGFDVAECRALKAVAVDATLNTRTYDPVAGSYSATAPTTVRCLQVPREDLYLYDSQGSARNKEGDVTMVLPAGTTVATKDTLTLDGVTWAVLAVQAVGGAVLVHGRRV